MGRRSRRRIESAKPVGKRDRPARVRVADETWREFRMAVVGDSAVATYLGQMVETEVSRHRVCSMRLARASNAELISAVERATALRDELVELVDRLESRLGRGLP
jgi:DTW domain-containing protein YfiP